MLSKRWVLWLVLLLAGGGIGAGAVIVGVEANRATSTDAFCSSCHSMATLAREPHFLRAAHRANRAGVRASCSDCHIPKTNWFVETYVHAASAVRDVIAENTHDYSDPKIWAARRVALAQEVRAIMRAQDSITCRHCHNAAAIQPTSEGGRTAHALPRQGGATCIDCHVNLVHAPPQP